MPYGSWLVPLLIQLPVQGLGKAAEDGIGVWTSAMHLRNLEIAPGFWLQPGFYGHLGSITVG